LLQLIVFHNSKMSEGTPLPLPKKIMLVRFLTNKSQKFLLRC
jgi:hypothetical protein